MRRHHFLSAYNSNYEPKLHFRQHDKYGNLLPKNYTPLQVYLSTQHQNFQLKEHFRLHQEVHHQLLVFLL